MTGEVAGEIKNGDLGTTFGGGMLAAAALEATVDVIRDEHLLDNVRDGFEYLKAELGRIPIVSEVRGLGYLLGLTFKGIAARTVQETLLERRIITGLADDPSVLRLLPPLTLRRPEIDLFLGALRELPV